MAEGPNIFSCACGGCEITATGAAMGQFYCHCASCQQAQSSSFMTVAAFNTAQVKVTKGSPTAFKKEKATRHFCGTCGVRMFVEPYGPDGPVRAVFPALKISGPLKLAPQMHCFYSERSMVVKDGLPKFSNAPKSFGGDDVLLTEEGGATAAGAAKEEESKASAEAETGAAAALAKMAAGGENFPSPEEVARVTTALGLDTEGQLTQALVLKIYNACWVAVAEEPGSCVAKFDDIRLDGLEAQDARLKTIPFSRGEFLENHKDDDPACAGGFVGKTCADMAYTLCKRGGGLHVHGEARQFVKLMLELENPRPLPVQVSAQVEAAFNQLDADGNGSLDADEVAAAVGGDRATGEEMIGEADADGDGKISVGEFAVIMGQS